VIKLQATFTESILHGETENHIEQNEK
jgi:hypothetical protein